MCYKFWCISSPSSAKHTWNGQIQGLWRTWAHSLQVLIFFFSLNAVPINSFPWQFGYIVEVKCVGIIVKKFENKDLLLSKVALLPPRFWHENRIIGVTANVPKTSYKLILKTNNGSNKILTCCANHFSSQRCKQKLIKWRRFSQGWILGTVRSI